MPAGHGKMEEPTDGSDSTSEEYSDVLEEGKGRKGDGKGPKGEGKGGGEAKGKGVCAPGLAPKRRPSPPRSPTSSDRAPRARRPSPSPARTTRRGRSRSRAERKPRRRADRGEPVEDWGQGKGKGHAPTRCSVCWRKVAPGAGLSQHQYWSTYCNSWRLHSREGMSWSQAVREAARIKAEREWLEADTVPAPSRKRRDELERTSAQEIEDWWQRVEGGGDWKEGKKKKKKARRPRTPSPVVKRSGRRGGGDGSEDGEEDGDGHGRGGIQVRRGPGRSLILTY